LALIYRSRDFFFGHFLFRIQGRRSDRFAISDGLWGCPPHLLAQVLEELKRNVATPIFSECFTLHFSEGYPEKTFSGLRIRILVYREAANLSA
jgi:hypothetical protein